MSVNKVIVVGNLGADPVVRALPNSGGKVANLSVASTERFTDRSGNKQARTEWFRVVAFGKLADTCERFLNKGRQVYVEGRLSTREYEAKDGSGKRYPHRSHRPPNQVLGQPQRRSGSGCGSSLLALAPTTGRAERFSPSLIEKNWTASQMGCKTSGCPAARAPDRTRSRYRRE